MKYVAKPLDVSPGRRLYRVSMHFAQHPAWNQDFFILEASPAAAADAVRDLHRLARWIEEPVFQGHGMLVLSPSPSPKKPATEPGKVEHITLTRTDPDTNN